MRRLIHLKLIPPFKKKRVKKISDVKSSKPRALVSRGPSIVKTDALPTAIACLRNSELKSSTGLKYPADLVAALRGMFSSSRVYKFQLHQALTVSSSAGGGTLGFVAISPSVASYGEWSALAALFDEVKAISTSIKWASVLVSGGSGGAVTNAPMCMALDQQDLSTDPASYLAVFRLASSREYVSQLGGGGSGLHSQSAVFTTRGWCDTAVPYSTSPMGGMIGCWVYGNGALFPVSTAVAVVSSYTIAAFRSRA